MDFKKYISIFIIALLSLNTYGQLESKGLPYIKNFTRAEYDGNPQVFNIIQDNRGVMYFTNQTYLLEYDGKTWEKIYLPNDPNVYALAKDSSGRIYVGASANEFGYLEVRDDGSTMYKSLADKIPEGKKEFTIVRKVEKTKKGHIIFVTPMTLYIYENDTIKTVDVKNPEKNNFSGSFSFNGRIFIHEKGVGISEFINDELKVLEGTQELYSTMQPFGMFPGPENSIYITSWQDSVRVLSEGVIQSVEKDQLLSSLIYPAIFDSNYFVGGTYGQGLIITDNNLNIVKHLSKKNGLQHNTVWCAYRDKDKNIWIGTDDGISVVYAGLPQTIFNDYTNLTEKVITSVQYGNNLYVGTPGGIFYKDFSLNNSIRGWKFEKIDAQGVTQIWKIDTLQNTIFFASQNGLYQIIDNKAELAGTAVSVKNFTKLNNYENKILVTGGSGLTLFELKNGKWQTGKILSNFKGFYNYIQEDKEGYFWISERSKGILRLKIDFEGDSVIEKIQYGVDKGLPDVSGNYVFKINDRVIFTTKKGIFTFDYEQNKFVKDSEFTEIFGEDIAIENIYQARNGNIWFKEVIEDPKVKNKYSWELGLLKKKGNDYEIIKTPFYKVKSNIYNINQVSENELIIGTERGFVHHDLSKNKDFNAPFQTLIRKVEFIKNDSILFGGTYTNSEGEISLLQDAKKIPKISHEFNDLRFFFSSIFYEEADKTMYKFILKGNDTEWTDWKTDTDKEYSNLAPGAYTFSVQAKNMYEVESEIAEYTFEILPPWYQTFIAYIGYFVVFVLFIYGVIQLSIYRVKQQREHLKRIVEERTQEIQIQKEEIEAKNETLSEQNEEIIQKNQSITASINYAKRIQEAMLPLKDKITAGLPENFILFKPRDIVSGDFYWYAEVGNLIIYTAVDCTGHGVPGALMSMIGSEILTTIINNEITKADRILEEMNDYVIQVLKQDSEGLSQDGMDMALCVIDKENKTIEYAGAKNPLIYIHEGKLTHIKGSRSGIGGYQQEAKDYESHIIKYKSPTWFYMFTDGFQDQFGGPKNRKYMIKRLKEMILDNHYKPMQEQNAILTKEIEEWMIDSPQTDDILLTGIKL